MGLFGFLGGSKSREIKKVQAELKASVNIGNKKTFDDNFNYGISTASEKIHFGDSSLPAVMMEKILADKNTSFEDWSLYVGFMAGVMDRKPIYIIQTASYARLAAKVFIHLQSKVTLIEGKVGQEILRHIIRAWQIKIKYLNRPEDAWSVKTNAPIFLAGVRNLS